MEIRAWMEKVPAIPNEPYSFPDTDLSSRFMIVPTEIWAHGTRIPLMESWKSVYELIDDDRPTVEEAIQNL